MRASNVWRIRDSRTKERAGIFFLQSIRVPRTERRRSCQLQKFPVQFDRSGLKEEGPEEGKKSTADFYGVHRRINFSEILIEVTSELRVRCTTRAEPKWKKNSTSSAQDCG